MRIRKINRLASIGDRYFDKEGNPLEVTEVDGNIAVIKDGDSERLGEMNAEVFKLGRLGFRAGLKALRVWGGDRHRDADVGLSYNDHTFVWFGPSLCVRFFKQKGRVPHFAPVTLEQAKLIADGKAELRYIKRTNRYRIVEL